MENKGVICDVSECRYNVDCCKCNLPQIKVTEHCASGSCGSQQVENPHFCQSYEKKKKPRVKSSPAAHPFQDGQRGNFGVRGALQRRVTLQVARLRTKVSTLSRIWMLFIPSWKAVWTLARLSSMKMHSLAVRRYRSSRHW